MFLYLFVLIFTGKLSKTHEFYYSKNDLSTKLIKITDDNYFEGFESAVMQPDAVFEKYTQGKILYNDSTLLFETVITDSLGLDVKENNINLERNKYFVKNKIKVVNERAFKNSIRGFNYEPLNRFSYSDDIKLCIEDSLGAKFYKRLLEIEKVYYEVITKHKPKCISLCIGNYTISKIYNVGMANSNYFEISVINNALFSLFSENYLSKHQFKKYGDSLIDLSTNEVYRKFIPKDQSKKINEISSDIRNN